MGRKSRTLEEWENAVLKQLEKIGEGKVSELEHVITRALDAAIDKLIRKFGVDVYNPHQAILETLRQATRFSPIAPITAAASALAGVRFRGP